MWIALLAASLAACGQKRDEPPAPPAPTASASVAPPPDAPRGPLSIVLESRAPVVFSGVEGGVLIADAARTRLARAAGEAELSDAPMPAGLPSGPGRILRAAGRMPHSLWLLFEKQRDDGKPESHPLFRLGKEGWKQLADDWKPAVAAWSKNRILAASTSSGRLKIKVVEPSLPKPPDDLPNVHLADISCEKTLALADLAALRTGAVFAAGTCKPDTAAGAGASAKRYVVIRWPTPASADAGAPAPDPNASDAGPIAAVSADAGAADPLPSGPLGIVDVLPGVSTALAHQALFARTAADVYVAAHDDTAARLFHFDGTTWGAEPLPGGAAVVRGVAGTADGALWLVTDHTIWRRPAAAPWEQIPPPTAGTWELFDIRAVADRDIWIAARRTDPSGPRDLILRTRPASTIIHWD